MLDWKLSPDDLSTKMLDEAHQFIDEKIDQSIVSRLKFWHLNFSSREAYEASVEPNRRRLMQYIGVEGKSKPIANYNVGFPDKKSYSAILHAIMERLNFFISISTGRECRAEQKIKQTKLSTLANNL